MSATAPQSFGELCRESATRWRVSAARWRGIARAALGDSNLAEVVYCLHNVAERERWAEEDEALAQRFGQQEATA